MEKKKKKYAENVQEPTTIPDLQIHVCSAGTVLSHSPRGSSADLEKELAEQDKENI